MDQASQSDKPTWVPEVPAHILQALAPSSDVAINSTHLSIQWLNELASILPARYRWQFPSADALKAEVEELRKAATSALEFNRLYWEDTLKNCEAYSIMATWRIIDLARSCVWALGRGDILCAAIMARSGLESTAQYLTSSRTVHATLTGMLHVDLQKDLLVSEELEAFLLKTIFASKMPVDDEIYKPTNIVTIIEKVAKIKGQENVLSFYQLLCEVAHPNYLGRSAHIREVIPGPRPGNEIRVLGAAQLDPTSCITQATVGTLSWACATHVSSFGVMRAAIGEFLNRIPDNPHGGD